MTRTCHESATCSVFAGRSRVHRGRGEERQRRGEDGRPGSSLTNDDIDVSYDVRRCIHAEECVRGLPAVFDTARRPWILPSAASADEIASVIQRCPSGAFHFDRRDGGRSEAPQPSTTIVPTAGGPLYVGGLVQLRSADGQPVFEDVRMALCRCGQSKSKPLCDNSHIAANFDDAGAVPESGASADNG